MVVPRPTIQAPSVTEGMHGLRITLIALLLARFGTAVLGNSIKDIPTTRTILKTGVTSLAWTNDPTSARLTIVGTKSGRILVFLPVPTPTTKDMENAMVEHWKWEELRTDEYSSKFPVYSVALTRNEDDEITTIFAGNGDRLVSVWRKQESIKGYQFLSTLGPHTGWVKAVAYHKKTDTLFSIGCNCIESWDCSQALVRHCSQRKIESSPDMGSTLSSDLLCLCVIKDDYLLSGGVDGRIHVWSLDPNVLVAYSSTRCHDGRVNAMTFSVNFGWVFSIGHDGAFVISKVEFDGSGMFVLGSHAVDGSPRLSALSVVQEDDTGCKLALGTTCGQVILLRAKRSKDATCIIIVEEKRFTIDDQPMIYSICPNQKQAGDDDPMSVAILVGHALGLIEVCNFC